MSDTLVGNGIGMLIGVIVVGALVWCLRSYLGSFLSKKAENLATKEDIKVLTRLQEEVKAEFNQLLERQRSEAQLRLAVVERRFQAHQEAHTLWMKLVSKVHSEQIADVVMECQTWWELNSLYLDGSARKAFKSAYSAAFYHKEMVQGPKDAELRGVIEKNWRLITAAGEVIEAAVNLPKLDISEIQKPGEPEPSALPDRV